MRKNNENNDTENEKLSELFEWLVWKLYNKIGIHWKIVNNS